MFEAASLEAAQARFRDELFMLVLLLKTQIAISERRPVGPAQWSAMGDELKSRIDSMSAWLATVEQAPLTSRVIVGPWRLGEGL